MGGGGRLGIGGSWGEGLGTGGGVRCSWGVGVGVRIEGSLRSRWWWLCGKGVGRDWWGRGVGLGDSTGQEGMLERREVG